MSHHDRRSAYHREQARLTRQAEAAELARQLDAEEAAQARQAQLTSVRYALQDLADDTRLLAQVQSESLYLQWLDHLRRP
jgi:hypothetical protein